MRIHIYSQYYHHPDQKKQELINKALLINANSDLVAKVWLSCERGAMPSGHPKIMPYSASKRSTYKALLKKANATHHADRDFIAIMNSDMVVTDSFNALALHVNRIDTALAISRREVNGEICQLPQWSQDCWIFKNHIFSNALISRSNLALGVAGCENMFAMALYTHGYNIWNPCHDVAAQHLDPTPQEFFKQRYFGAYLFIPPCRISDIEKKASTYEVMHKTYREGVTEEPYPS